MRLMLAVLLGLFALVHTPLAGVQQAPQGKPPQGRGQRAAQMPPSQNLPATPSALQSDPNGWLDLLADRTLKNWVRVPLPKGLLRAGDMNDPSPWKLDASGQVLICEGAEAGHEMFRYNTEWADQTLHAEWRFTKLEGEPAYNAGIYIRTSADGNIWHQAQTGPGGGFLFASTLVNGATQFVNLSKTMKENRVNPAGEWNTYEVTAVGRRITLWVNGAVTSEFTECDVPKGYVGLEAEGYRIEFRNLKVKPAGQ